MDYKLICVQQNEQIAVLHQTSKNNLSQHALRSLYYALIHLHLTYCPIILSCTNKTNINPNSTGQGQSWPRQLWRQIPDKILIYQIFFYLTYSFRNIFQIFLNFWHDLKKWCFDVHFDVFLSEILSRRYSAVFPASDRFYCYYRPPELGRSPDGPRSAVRSGANKIPISYRSWAA